MMEEMTPTQGAASSSLRPTKKSFSISSKSQFDLSNPRTPTTSQEELKGLVKNGKILTKPQEYVDFDLLAEIEDMMQANHKLAARKYYILRQTYPDKHVTAGEIGLDDTNYHDQMVMHHLRYIA